MATAETNINNIVEFCQLPWQHGNFKMVIYFLLSSLPVKYIYNTFLWFSLQESVALLVLHTSN